MGMKLRKLRQIILFSIVVVFAIVCLYLVSRGARSETQTPVDLPLVDQPPPTTEVDQSSTQEGREGNEQDHPEDSSSSSVVTDDQIDPSLLYEWSESESSSDSNENFFISCSGMQLWQLCSEISAYFNVNILVFDDIKDKVIFGDIRGVSLVQVLDSISWYCGVEYVERDGIYYVGSNTKTILVLPLSGLKDKVETIFQDVQVHTINDKMLIYGTERDVARVKAVYEDLVRQYYCIVHLYAVELAYDKNLTIGFDLDQSVKYVFSWENLLENSYNPFQSLAVSLYASLEADADQLRVRSVIDTDIGMLSGENVRIQMGQEEDRPVYTQSEYGNQVVSGYSTQITGLIIDLTASFDQKDWILNFQIENSDARSSVVKTLTKITSKVRLNEQNQVVLLAKLDLSTVTESYSKGIPFLCDIPWLGYLFRVSREREYDRQIYFVVYLKRDYERLPADIDPPDLIDASHAIEDIL